MQELSGIALIAAGVLLLVASRRACSTCGETWFTSDAFVMSVVGPAFIVSLAGGLGCLFVSSMRDDRNVTALAGLAVAAVVSGLAALVWLQTRRLRQPAARTAEIHAFTAPDATPAGGSSNPEAPGPPVTPRSRRAA